MIFILMNGGITRLEQPKMPGEVILVTRGHQMFCFMDISSLYTVTFLMIHRTFNSITGPQT